VYIYTQTFVMFKRACDYLKSWTTGKDKPTSRTKTSIKGGQTGDFEPVPGTATGTATAESQAEEPLLDNLESNPVPNPDFSENLQNTEPGISESNEQEPLLDNTEGPTGALQEPIQPIQEGPTGVLEQIPSEPAVPEISEQPVGQGPLLDNPEGPTGILQEPVEEPVEEGPTGILEQPTAEPVVPEISEQPVEQGSLLDNPEGPTGDLQEPIQEGPTGILEQPTTEPAVSEISEQSVEQKHLLDNPEGPTDNIVEESTNPELQLQEPPAPAPEQGPLLDNTEGPTDNLQEPVEIPDEEPEQIDEDQGEEEGQGEDQEQGPTDNLEIEPEISEQSVEQGPLLDNTEGPTEDFGDEPPMDQEVDVEPEPEVGAEDLGMAAMAAVAITPLFIEPPEDFFDKSTSTFLNSEILEYTVYFSIYRINTSTPSHPFLQYLCMTGPDSQSLTFPKTTYSNAPSDYPPNENPDDSPIDARFTDEITKFLLDTTQIQTDDFSQIYKGVIPMSMDLDSNRILFVFVDFSEIADLSVIPPEQSWKLCSDLAGYWIGLEKRPPAVDVDENIKILFDEHYEISRLRNEADETVLKSPLTVYLCEYAPETQGWSNVVAEEGSNRVIDLIPRQDHPFGYYPFFSMNVIGGVDRETLRKYVFFVESIRNTLYILPTVEGGEAPGGIDLYDGSVFKPTCLEDQDITEQPEENEEGETVLEEKKYSAIYFEDQGNVLWCVKNTDLVARL